MHIFVEYYKRSYESIGPDQRSMEMVKRNKKIPTGSKGSLSETQILVRSCHGSLSDGYQRSVAPGSRNLWWTEWHWDRFLSEFFGFLPCQYYFTVDPYSYIIRGMNNRPQFRYIVLPHRHVQHVREWIMSTSEARVLKGAWRGGGKCIECSESFWENREADLLESIVVFWVVTPCGLVASYNHSRQFSPPWKLHISLYWRYNVIFSKKSYWISYTEILSYTECVPRIAKPNMPTIKDLRPTVALEINLH
jgi:hypothetical protein